MLMRGLTVILVLPRIPWMVVCWQSSHLLVGYRSSSVVNMKPNYRIVLSPTTGVSGAPLISWCQAGCAAKPAPKWGSSNSNELWYTDWLQLHFLFSSYFACKSPCRFGVHLVFVLSCVKDMCCSGSQCAGRTKLTSRWPLMYPQELYFLPFSACRAIYSSSLMARSHGGFSCTLCEFGPCLRTHQECYLLLFEMLVAVVGAGD